MIVVKVPDEIRKYEERILLGLTARQLLATVITVVICVPLFWFGRRFLSDQVLAWLILIIALPLLSIGFVRINMLPMEKFAVAYFKSEFLSPRRRLFRCINAFRYWQNIAEKEEAPKGWLNKWRYKRDELSASLERSVLIMEAEATGNMSLDVDKCPLVTVSSGYGNGGDDGNKNNKPKKNKDKTVKAKDPSFKIIAESAKKKMEDDPKYVLSNKERNCLTKWNNYQAAQRKREISEKKKKAASINAKMKKRETAISTIPRTTQQTIPYVVDYDEGMFEVSSGSFSKVYELLDLNYQTSKEGEQQGIFYNLGEFYNSFPDDVNFAVTVDNRYISMDIQEQQMFFEETGDEYDKHRREMNRIMRQQIAMGRNDMQVVIYLSVTIKSKTPIEALLRFHKIDELVVNHMRNISSDAKVLSTTERLALYHDRFRKGQEGKFQVDYDFLKLQGLSSKDYIAPTYFEFNRTHFQIEDEFYRIMYINNLPSMLRDDFLRSLCDNTFPVTVTLSTQPVAQDKGQKIVRKQLTGIKTNQIEAEKRAKKAGYDPNNISHDIKYARAQAEQLFEDIRSRDQRLFFTTITVMIQGSSLNELKENCKVVESKVSAITAQLQILSRQQEEGMKVTLPFGYVPKELGIDRTLTTDSLAAFMPFKSRELYRPGGFFYGLNQISGNAIVFDRYDMKTPSGVVLGTPGSGKSMTGAKQEMLAAFLKFPTANALIIDPENEYGRYAKMLNGTVIKISADSANYINPMECYEDYGLDEDDPDDAPIELKIDKAWKKKTAFLMGIIERMLTTKLTAQQKTLIDRCIKRCYKEYFKNHFDPAYLPTLLDLQAEFEKEQGTEDGRLVAEAVEYFTRGSQSVFANKTNINIDNRIVVFNIRDLEDQLREIAYNIIFDFIWNRMVKNKAKGIRTYCYCDEIHVMFKSSYTAGFLQQLYKRGRKYGLYITGLTQNVADLISSEYARSIISNSDYVMMLNQHSDDFKILAEMLKISDTLAPYVTGAEPGCGLLFAENAIIPFTNRFPKDSYLYVEMSTKFGENS